MGAALDPEVVGIPPEGWPEGRETAQGSEALLHQFERLKDSWEEEHLDVLDVSEVEGVVLVQGQWITRGRNSGIEMQVPVSIRVIVRGGKIAQAEFRVRD